MGNPGEVKRKSTARDSEESRRDGLMEALDCTPVGNNTDLQPNVVQNPVLILLNVPSKAHENTTHFVIVTKVDVDRIDLCIHRQTGQIKLHK